MDLISEPSRGANLIAQSMVLPPALPAPTATAAAVEVYWQEKDADGALLGTPNLLGRFSPGAAGSFSYNPVAGKTVALFAVSFNAWNVPHVQELRDAVTDEVGVTRTTATVAGLDEHVPTVTKPPGIAQVGDGFNEWLVLTPDPDANGAMLTHCEIKVEKADEPAVFVVWPFYPAAQHRVPQTAYPAKVSYRLRNQSEETMGGVEDRGWSVWSPTADAPEMFNNAGLPSAADALADYDYNEFDSRAGISKGVIVS